MAPVRILFTLGDTGFLGNNLTNGVGALFAMVLRRFFKNKGKTVVIRSVESGRKTTGSKRADVVIFLQSITKRTTVDDIVRNCKKLDISRIIPTEVPDARFLTKNQSELRSRIPNLRLLVSGNPDVYEILDNKLLLDAFARKLGIPVPNTLYGEFCDDQVLNRFVEEVKESTGPRNVTEAAYRAWERLATNSGHMDRLVAAGAPGDGRLIAYQGNEAGGMVDNEEKQRQFESVFNEEMMRCGVAHGQDAARTDRSEEPIPRMFWKKAFGTCAGRGVWPVKSRSDMNEHVKRDPTFILQEGVLGQRYSVDCLFVQGVMKAVFAKKELDLGFQVPIRKFFFPTKTTQLHTDVEAEVLLKMVPLCEKIGSAVAYSGVMDIEFIVDNVSNTPVLLEVNPRFPGGNYTWIHSDFMTHYFNCLEETLSWGFVQDLYMDIETTEPFSSSRDDTSSSGKEESSSDAGSAAARSPDTSPTRPNQYNVTSNAMCVSSVGSTTCWSGSDVYYQFSESDFAVPMHKFSKSNDTTFLPFARRSNRTDSESPPLYDGEIIPLKKIMQPCALSDEAVQQLAWRRHLRCKAPSKACLEIKMLEGVSRDVTAVTLNGSVATAAPAPDTLPVTRDSFVELCSLGTRMGTLHEVALGKGCARHVKTALNLGRVVFLSNLHRGETLGQDEDDDDFELFDQCGGEASSGCSDPGEDD